MNFELVEGFTKRVNMYDKDSQIHIYNHWTNIKVTSVMADQFTTPSLMKTTHTRARAYNRVRAWIDEHIEGRWANHIHLFYFEDPKDATYFLLRWK